MDQLCSVPSHSDWLALRYLNISACNTLHFRTSLNSTDFNALHSIALHNNALHRTEAQYTTTHCTTMHQGISMYTVPIPYHCNTLHKIAVRSIHEKQTWCINYMLHHVPMHRIIAIAPLLSSTPRVGGPRQVNRNETERRIHRRAAQAAGVPRPSRTHEPNSDVSQSTINTSKSMKMQNMRSTKTWRRSS